MAVAGLTLDMPGSLWDTLNSIVKPLGDAQAGEYSEEVKVAPPAHR